MKKFLFKITLLFATVSLLSCEKGLITYDNKNSDVYFFDAGKSTQPNFDQSYISFQYVTKPDTTVNIIVATSGLAADHDREYKLVLGHLSQEELLYDHDGNATTPTIPMLEAIEGKHFEKLPEKFVIKKGVYRDTIKVKLLRSPDIITNRLALVFDLQANENFGNSLKSRLVGGKPISTIKTTILFDDKDTKPKYWLDNSFGTYSREKLFFICDLFGISPRYFETPQDIGEINGYGKFAQRRLNELAAAGTPVYEKNGTTRMVMGFNAQ